MAVPVQWLQVAQLCIVVGILDLLIIYLYLEAVGYVTAYYYESLQQLLSSGLSSPCLSPSVPHYV